jgi:hypothetical protein
MWVCVIVAIEDGSLPLWPLEPHTAWLCGCAGSQIIRREMRSKSSMNWMICILYSRSPLRLRTQAAVLVRTHIYEINQ